uniref:WGS project CBMI000000000 data, contig CS3069_c004065 n=1 Tax=Fusarium clavum TaxID=2594811 RepID=A0A090N608_9HYPO|nr:unnamed protein product [Fusarium clavum]
MVVEVLEDTSSIAHLLGCLFPPQVQGIWSDLTTQNQEALQQAERAATYPTGFLFFCQILGLSSPNPYGASSLSNSEGHEAHTSSIWLRCESVSNEARTQLQAIFREVDQYRMTKSDYSKKIYQNDLHVKVECQIDGCIGPAWRRWKSAAEVMSTRTASVVNFVLPSAPGALAPSKASEELNYRPKFEKAFANFASSLPHRFVEAYDVKQQHEASDTTVILARLL